MSRENGFGQPETVHSLELLQQVFDHHLPGPVERLDGIGTRDSGVQLVSLPEGFHVTADDIPVDGVTTRASLSYLNGVLHVTRGRKDRQVPVYEEKEPIVRGILTRTLETYPLPETPTTPAAGRPESHSQTEHSRLMARRLLLRGLL